jgi:hypothetical protein
MSTQRAGPEVSLYNSIREVLGSNFGKDIGYPDSSLHSFSLSPQSNTGVVPQIGHDRFLPRIFQFIYLSAIRLCMASMLAVVKQHTTEDALFIFTII